MKYFKMLVFVDKCRNVRVVPSRLGFVLIEKMKSDLRKQQIHFNKNRFKQKNGVVGMNHKQMWSWFVLFTAQVTTNIKTKRRTRLSFKIAVKNVLKRLSQNRRLSLAQTSHQIIIIIHQRKPAMMKIKWLWHACLLIAWLHLHFSTPPQAPASSLATTAASVSLSESCPPSM